MFSVRVRRRLGECSMKRLPVAAVAIGALHLVDQPGAQDTDAIDDVAAAMRHSFLDLRSPHCGFFKRTRFSAASPYLYGQAVPHCLHSARHDGYDEHDK